MSRSYTAEELRKAVAESFSYRQTLIKLKLCETGGAYPSLKRAIKEHNVDISHFTGQGWNSGKVIGAKYPIEDYLSGIRFIQSHPLKKKLIKEGLIDNKCSCCGLKDWLGKDLALELHHKDGDNKNNALNNLCLLCPNCHSQTENHRGKNKSKRDKRIRMRELTDRECFECKNKLLSTQIKYCSKQCSFKHCKRQYKEQFIKCLMCENLCKRKQKFCSYECSRLNSRKVQWPTQEQLEEDMKTMSMVAIGKKYGVSDNSVRKWLKHYQNKNIGMVGDDPTNP